jgi:hypothetical protein
MGIILRQNKGTELTFAEVDGNFQSLYYSSSLSGTDLKFFFASSSVTHSIDLNNLPGLTGITIESGSTQIETGVQTLNFLGSGIADVTSVGGNQVDITISGGGGSGGTGIFELVSGTDIYQTTSSLQVTASTYQQSSYTAIGVTQNPNNAGTGGGVDKYGMMFSQSIWHYTDNVGYPTTKAWKTDLNGSYFNNYDHNTDTAEILRFVAGLLSASAPDASPNTRYYANTSEVKTNTSTVSAPVGFIPQSSTDTNIIYLNSKGFATPGQTVFSSISPLYSDPTYLIRYTSVAGGSTIVSSSVDTQLFGLGNIGVPFNVSGGLDFVFSDNSIHTPTATSASENFLTRTGPGTSNGLTIGDIATSDPLIPQAYQDGKFVTVFNANLYNNNINFTTKESTGYYQISSSIGIQSGSSNYSTFYDQKTEIFYTPITDSDFTTNTPTIGYYGSASLSATSRSLSGAPYLSTANWESSASITNAFNPLFNSNTTFARVNESDSLVSSANGNTGVYQGSTNGGTVQTSNFIYDNAGTTPRTIGTIPSETDLVKLTASLSFNAGASGAENINQTGLGTTTFSTTDQCRNRVGSLITTNTNTYEYFKPGTFGQDIASGSMGYYGRAQGYDGGTLTAFNENFTGEDYRILITDNLLTGSYTDGDKPVTGTYQEYVQDPLELQVKPGYLITPGGTYGYWSPANPSANDYQYYSRAFQRNSASGAGSVTMSLGTTLNAWESTSNGISAAIIFESSGVDFYPTPRIYDPTQTTSGLIDASVPNDDFKNPFSDNIALYGNTTGGIDGTTYKIPLRNIDGMTLDGTYQDFIVIIRYKGDPTPVSNITITIN